MIRRPFLAAITALGLIFSANLHAADAIATYPDSAAQQHVGEEAIVTGRIVASGKSKQGNQYFNFGAKFPKQTFSAVIKAPDVEKFGDLTRFDGKLVSVRGKIDLHNDKPEIVLTSPEQITILPEPAK